MTRNSTLLPNPRRVTAGRMNYMKRKGLSSDGRERLRQAALCNRPWIRSTGPRSAAGRAQAAINGKRRQVGPVSTRELKAELAAVRSLVRGLRGLRLELVKGGDT